jgi:hypothetical protein
MARFLFNPETELDDSWAHVVSHGGKNFALFAYINAVTPVPALASVCHQIDGTTITEEERYANWPRSLSSAAATADGYSTAFIRGLSRQWNGTTSRVAKSSGKMINYMPHHGQRPSPKSNR